MSEQLTIGHTSIDSATEEVSVGDSRIDTVLEQLSVGAQYGRNVYHAWAEEVSVWAQYDRQRVGETIHRNTVRQTPRLKKYPSRHSTTDIVSEESILRGTVR